MAWSSAFRPWVITLEAFLLSTGIVALAEMGDKTQLLALVLAARFRRPVPIIAAILLATVVNHGIAGALGSWLTAVVDPDVLRWVLGLSFIAMALWMLVPDKLDADEEAPSRYGVFMTTLIAFFLAEMGDKTQVATIALAAKYAAFSLVVLGTTVGMMIANVPAVLIGDRVAGKLPLRMIHGVAAAIFAILGVLALLNVGNALGA
jgi:putative Ca2+/H+ antiporter (TMEM165/GDT1 family)